MEEILTIIGISVCCFPFLIMLLYYISNRCHYETNDKHETKNSEEDVCKIIFRMYVINDYEGCSRYEREKYQENIDIIFNLNLADYKESKKEKYRCNNPHTDGYNINTKSNKDLLQDFPISECWLHIPTIYVYKRESQKQCKCNVTIFFLQ